MEKSEPSRVADGEYKWCSHFGKHQAITQKLNKNPDISLLETYTREMKTHPHESLYTNAQMFVTA